MDNGPDTVYGAAVGLGDAFAPLTERQFRLLWLGRVSSYAGDALMPVALAFAVLSVNRHAWALGSVLAAFWTSRVALTLVGGVVADRLPRRAVMLACDGLRACVEIFTAAMLWSHEMTLPLFFLTGAVFGVASAFFGPASDGLIPQTITDANLQRANALLGISSNTMNVFGPAVSGGLIAVVGTPIVFLIDGASFFVSAFFLMRLRISPHARAAKTRFLVQMRAGFDEVRSRDWVRAPILGFAITNFCFAAFLVLGPVVFRTHFGETHARVAWGAVSTCGAIGAILGSFAVARLRPRRPLTFGFACAFAFGLPMLALARPLPAEAIALAWFLGATSIAISNTFWETNLQRRIPAEVFARVRSYDILVSFVFLPIGLVTFPLIANAVGDERTLIATGIVCAVTNVAVAFTPGVRAVTDDAVAPLAEPQVRAA